VHSSLGEIFKLDLLSIVRGILSYLETQTDETEESNSKYNPAAKNYFITGLVLIVV